MSQASMTTPGGDEYEFDEYQNELIRALARDMSFAGVFSLALCVGYALGIVAAIATRQWGSLLYLITSGAFFLAMGTWLRKASEGFERIVSTRGHDISNLMGALGELSAMFKLLKLLMLVYLVVFAFGIGLLLFSLLVIGQSPFG